LKRLNSAKEMAIISLTNQEVNCNPLPFRRIARMQISAWAYSRWTGYRWTVADTLVKQMTPEGHWGCPDAFHHNSVNIVRTVQHADNAVSGGDCNSLPTISYRSRRNKNDRAGEAAQETQSADCLGFLLGFAARAPLGDP
jgi:hypothetical protein